MKKIVFILSFLAVLVSCQNDSLLDIQEVQPVSKVSSTNPEFVEAYNELIKVHKNLEIFREVLPTHLLDVMDRDMYTEYTAISIISIWWKEKTGDILIEYPTWDIFIENLPEKYQNLFSWELYF